MRLNKAIKPLLASLIFPPLCTTQFLSIDEKFNNVHACVSRCLDAINYNDVIEALSCGSPVDNACYCPTETSSISKATSFLASCATASCAAGDLKRDEPFMLGMYATYCYEAGFTQPGLEPTEAPSTATSDSPPSAEPSSTQSSAPKGSNSQPSMTEGDGSGAGTSTQMTIVTHTQESDATKSQGTFQPRSLVAVLVLIQLCVNWVLPAYPINSVSALARC